MKLNSAGDILWTSAFGGTVNTRSKMFSKINSNEYISVCSQIDYSFNTSNTWMIKIDDEGEIIWEKIFGNRGKNDGFSAIPAFDGGFIFTGRSNSLVNDDEILFDLWLLKTDPSGYSKFN